MKDKRNKKSWFYKVVAILVLVVCIIGVIPIITMIEKPITFDITYSELMKMLEDEDVAKATIYSGKYHIDITTKDGKVLKTPNPGYDEFRKDLYSYDIEIELFPSSGEDKFDKAVKFILPVVYLGFMLMMVFYIYFMVKESLGHTFEVIEPDKINITYKDIAGLDSTMEEIKYIANSLTSAKEIEDAGGRVCKGVLLEGPPGTGKTMIAKAIAKDSGVPFISCAGSDFNNLYIGMGSRNIRKVFEEARKYDTCVIFIDEIDAVASKRSDNSSGNEEGRTVGALLKEMDGLNKSGKNILMLGATNRLDMIDEAVVRPGRFDRTIRIDSTATDRDRKQMVELHLRNKKIDSSVDIDRITSMFRGMSGAEIEGILNESVMISIMNGFDGIIRFKDIDKAFSRFMLKTSSFEKLIGDKLDLISIHEAGHAIVSLLLGYKVSKATVLSSNNVGGYILSDVHYVDLPKRSEMIDKIKVYYGGLIAEKLIIGDYSYGCVSDIEKATELIKQYISLYGYGVDKDRDSYINRVVANSKIDLECEIRELANSIVSDVTQLLDMNIELIHKLSERLKVEDTVYSLNSIKDI